MAELLPVQGLEALAPARWRGRVGFPNRIQPTAILILEFDGAWIGVRAHCPHEGQDLSDCPLDGGCNLVCPRHGRVIDLSGPDAFRLARRGEAFAVPWPLECAS